MPALDVNSFGPGVASSSSRATRSLNTLLASLPHVEYERIAPHLKSVSLKREQIVYKQDETIAHVLFPGGGACSLVKTTTEGEEAEVATVGIEGAVGAHVFFGQRESPCRVLVQISTPFAHLIDVNVFIREMERHETFFTLMIRYNQALMSQIMQATLCSSLHSAEERCCRWLLMTHDRARRNEFEFTQEMMAARLGVRRPTITIILGKLQRASLIECRRGSLTIVDRKNLELAACQCYEAAKLSFNRLLPETGASVGR